MLSQVKRKLRDFGEPAVLFGEDAYERRERPAAGERSREAVNVPRIGF